MLEVLSSLHRASSDRYPFLGCSCWRPCRLVAPAAHAGWQCMFGPSPYIGVLSPEQRPWRRSCHHRSVVGVHPRIGCPCAWGLPLFLGGIHLFGWSINGWRPAWMESNLWWAANLAPQLQPSDDLAWLWSAPPTSSLVGSLVSSASIRVGTRRARGLGARWV